MLTRRLLDAAVDQFGRFGFDRASTRTIAKASGTTMSSITYHFGSKEGLYLAAADHIAKAMSERQRPIIDNLRQRPLSTREEAIAACIAFLDGFAAMMLSPECAPWARFIAREHFEPSAAFERIWDSSMTGTPAIMLGLVGKALPSVPEREQHALVALLLGQAITLHAGLASVCRVLGSDHVDVADIAFLRRRLAWAAEAILRDAGQAKTD